MHLAETALVEFALVLIVTGQRAIDKPDHARAVRARGFIIGDNLAGDGVDFSRGTGVKPGELLVLSAEHFSPASGRQHPLTSCDFHFASN
jgi:hypothetical protein